MRYSQDNCNDSITLSIIAVFTIVTSYRRVVFRALGLNDERSESFGGWSERSRAGRAYLQAGPKSGGIMSQTDSYVKGIRLEFCEFHKRLLTLFKRKIKSCGLKFRNKIDASKLYFFARFYNLAAGGSCGEQAGRSELRLDVCNYCASLIATRKRGFVFEQERRMTKQFLSILEQILGQFPRQTRAFYMGFALGVIFTSVYIIAILAIAAELAN